MSPLLGLMLLLLPPCIAVPLYLLLLPLLLACYCYSPRCFFRAFMFTFCCGCRFLLPHLQHLELKACERGRRWPAALALFAELAAKGADDVVCLDGYLVRSAVAVEEEAAKVVE